MPESPAAPPLFKRLALIGIGLIGSSVARIAMERRHIAAEVVANARTQATLDRVLELGIADHVELDPAKAVQGADCVMLCAPVGAYAALAEAIAPHLAPGAIVTDVGSTKVDICRHGAAAFPERADGTARFVGGHPMAGSEKSGLGAADPLLYQSALWVLCPPPDLDDGRLDALRAMVQAVGARVAILDPALHDAAVARISHVPQVLASVLAGWAGAAPASAEAALALAAGGFRDMTRLALSSWEVWRDIIATNQAPIADGLQALSLELATLAAAAREGTRAQDAAAAQPDVSRTVAEAAFREAFTRGRTFRERFRMPRKGIVHDLTELVVRLEDRPGQLLALFTPLAAAGINVQDLEILKVREGESGTILLGFATPDEAHRAARHIAAAGFSVTER